MGASATTPAQTQTHDGGELHTIPIKARPPATTSPLLAYGIPLLLFLMAAVVQPLQLLVTPFAYFAATRPFYDWTIRCTKQAGARMLMILTHFFGPSQLVVSFGDGKGGYLDPTQFVHRNSQNGKFDRIDLPSNTVAISNHQVYTDWLYLWYFAYFADLSDSVVILLKKSLRWIPLIGWGMQYWNFIFMSQKWADDQANLDRQLAEAAQAQKILLLIFPEGTLVSRLTRPSSKKYADKMEIDDMKNLLLPRSRGLLFCLRSLAAEKEDLYLLDFTMGYPGVNPAGYGQDFYSLKSVLIQGVPPPCIHLHVELIPVGKACQFKGATIPTSSNQTRPPIGDLSSATGLEDQLEKFDEWIRNKWTQKDGMMDRFYQHGDFVEGSYDETKDETDRYVVLPMRLRSLWEVGHACCWCILFPIVWILYRPFR